MLPFALVGISGTDNSISTNSNGSFQLTVPLRFSYTACSFNWLSEKTLIWDARNVSELKIELEPLDISLSEVVISATRRETDKRNSPVQVSVLNRKMLELTQSNNLSEGLCFQPGLRMETDCQTCGYSQLRMNGMPGSYSQVLINSRPVFSSVLSLYGLEMFPSAIIERVEVVKGGGSVLFGSSAIAGTVNIITRKPGTERLGAFLSTALIGNKTHDINTGVTVGRSFNAGKSGIQVILAGQNRNGYDANADGYTELPRISSAKGGISFISNLGQKAQIKSDVIFLQEERQGGNLIYGTPHLADQGEFRNHLVGALTTELEYNIGRQAGINLYASGQRTTRDHYTGIDHSEGYGNSLQTSFQSGIQFNYRSASEKHNVTAGIEHFAENTFDEIVAYNYLIDQKIELIGIFLQHDWKILNHLELLSGYRANLSNRIAGVAHTPRVQLFYHPGKHWQFRAGWSEGFRAPQAFDTDMHIAFAGGQVSVIQIDPNLKPEFSSAYNASISWNLSNTKRYFSLSADYFRNTLSNNFILSEIANPANDKQILYRSNGDGAKFEGLNFGMELASAKGLNCNAGFTIQNAGLNSPVYWSEDQPAEKRLLRTPLTYGFGIIEWPLNKKWNSAANLTYTGSMLVPHFAGAPGVNQDELVITKAFISTGINFTWASKLSISGKALKIQFGVNNITNAYQDDFDSGKNRDSNYVYGPAKPRTWFVVIRI
ncbi:MAG: TonB-dependent receptor [Bacteroidia bacterium]